MSLCFFSWGGGEESALTCSFQQPHRFVNWGLVHSLLHGFYLYYFPWCSFIVVLWSALHGVLDPILSSTKCFTRSQGWEIWELWELCAAEAAPGGSAAITMPLNEYIELYHKRYGYRLVTMRKRERRKVEKLMNIQRRQKGDWSES